MQTTHEAPRGVAALAAIPRDTVADHHREALHRRGLTDEAIKANGLYTESVHCLLAAKLAWKRYPKGMGQALVIPFRDADGRELGVAKLRPDGPRTNAKSGKPIKYEWRKGEPPRVYFPAGIGEHLAGDGPLFVTEGEFKAIVATERGFPTIGLPGVYGLFQKGSADPPLEIERINWKRPVYIVFDSDLVDNPQVQKAEASTAAILARRGGTVKVIRLPSGPNGAKVGLDDFLATHSDGDFHRLVNAAEDPAEPTPEMQKDHANGIDPMEEARHIVAAHFTEGGALTLRHHRDGWNRWRRGRYREVPACDVRAGIMLFLDRTYYGVTGAAVSNVAEGLKALTNLPGDVEPPCWLGGGPRSRPLVSVANGLLDIEKAVAGDDGSLQPHSPEWFSPVRLPYTFDATADCPVWRRVIAQNVDGDADRHDLLQQWFGYLLRPTTDLQKFLLLYGDGGTGKSAALAAMVAMLGVENVSSVPLEQFGDRFSLHGTLGKLANVAAEIGEIDKAAEGHLKSLSSGDRMTFERKHRDPIFAPPTARLVFSTNTLPRFADRSGGLWRRMILMPFDRVIPPEERIPGLDKPEGWAERGELPGILNWAIEGLRQLRRYGFTEPEVCEAALAAYRTESNPAKVFLLDHYRENQFGREPKSDIYQRYRAWCEENGYRPLSTGPFGKEVRRTFPTVEEERPSIEGERVHCYVGIARGAG